MVFLPTLFAFPGFELIHTLQLTHFTLLFIPHLLTHMSVQDRTPTFL